jgi:hypothetical protein
MRKVAADQGLEKSKKISPRHVDCGAPSSFGEQRPPKDRPARKDRDMTSTLLTKTDRKLSDRTAERWATDPAAAPHAGYVRSGLASGVAAAAANLAVFGLARLFDVRLEIADEVIPAFGFPQLTFICALIGVGMAAVFVRRCHRPRRTFVRTTLGLTAVSMVPPVLVDADSATKTVLALTHIVAAAIIIPAIAARLHD